MAFERFADERLQGKAEAVPERRLGGAFELFSDAFGNEQALGRQERTGKVISTTRTSLRRIMQPLASRAVSGSLLMMSSK